MNLLRIYQCLGDETRLRILHLLQEGELCVCHLQAILREPQVKVSKHLACLRRHGLVEARREANWMIYRLPARPGRALRLNLACLHVCAEEHALLRRDRERLRRLRPRLTADSPLGCGAKAPRSAASGRGTAAAK